MLDPTKIDFTKIGFHAGLEIHHQINARRKLFCHCPPIMVSNATPPDYRFERYFRPVLGEMGDFDPGMLIEYEKGYRVIYHAFEKCDCIYEQDEQPPMHPDEEALMSGYELAHWLNCQALVDEIIFARKQYLDGSITTGFQRTTIVARDGWVMVDGKKIKITNLTVEEDSARKIRTENNGRTVYYNLDRLGIPLVEVITDYLDVSTPEELIKTAKTIGLILRLSGIGRRGIGSARQDVNISIKGGDRVELKGVQDLENFDRLCRHEICRQDTLIQIAQELKQRGLHKEDFEHTYLDISHLFSDIPEKAIIMGIRLPKLQGILGREEQPGKDFGQDILEKASLISGVPIKHLFHSDAIESNFISEDNYFKQRITDSLHNEITQTLGCGGNDAYVIALGSQKWTIHAMKKVIERIKMAFDGVPQETRKALPNGNSEFLRVIHGKERLYPDTDTPVLDMDMDAIEKLASKVRKRPWEYEKEYCGKDGITFNQLTELIRHERIELFERLVNLHHIPPKRVYHFLEETLLGLKRDGIDVLKLSNEKITELLLMAQNQRYDWALLQDLVISTLKHPTFSLNQILDSFGAKKIDENQLKNQLEQEYAYALEAFNAFQRKSRKYQIQNTNSDTKKGESVKISVDDLQYQCNQITGLIMRKINHAISGKRVADFVYQKITGGM
ncbi:MAG: Glu-tRNA(Gln) amidotransferase subunit GatE [Candidatus Lokiarchaeota archaeon]|nr:Glu-tRNA(Gln) amidotransferase subunit GatE [Candidatus Harpocratesius repetitus]